MTIPKELEGVLAVHPEIISGAVRFKGTRVPVQALMDTLDGGESIEDFLEGWPDVSLKQAEAVISLAPKIRAGLDGELSEFPFP